MSDQSQSLLQNTRRRLAALSDTPYLDAQVLLSHVLGRQRVWILAHPSPSLTPRQREDLAQALLRLESGVPLPYVIGHWEFYALDFTITPHVLIPRPETELLVEKALNWLRRHPARRSCADIGTGSGCIAITLAKHIPDAKILATDISFRALRVAQGNARKHDVEAQISFLGDNLLAGVTQRFDVVCANLPYVPTPALKTLQVYGREPTQALDGGPKGLTVIQSLMEMVPHNLAPGGLILLEIDSSHSLEAARLAQGAFPAAEVRLHADLAGHDRILAIQT
ncbi:MAG: protein-(glutamine-N5) methyltransferase, release factor-specific [Anaerolineaceae bacterium 4572_5.2]|nr:MAG: protein-(glutamine-N5) methyltransferase, release factor-specific [Anaerolineaceae bacterium 4572_5.2]